MTRSVRTGPPMRSCRVHALAGLGLILAASWCATAGAGEIVGKPRIVDGDTMDIGGRTIGLDGIDAPEFDQSCMIGTTRWPCGRNAMLALSRIVGTNWVSCTVRGPRALGRLRAVCHLAGVQGPDIGRMMVAEGWAMPAPGGAGSYGGDAAAAKRARLGIWRGDIVNPWAWRRGIRLPEGDERQQACVIKGEIGRRGARIYHLPRGRDYARVRIEPSKGDRWFCTEAEARAAGWRRSPR